MHARRIHRITIVVILFLVLAPLAGCGGAPVNAPAAKVTCEQFLKRMHAKDLQGAYACLTTACRAATTQQQTQDLWDLVEKNRGTIRSWYADGEMADYGSGGPAFEVNYVLECDTHEGAVHFICIEEDGKWLIRSFDFAA